ncbi:MAG: hypothetical protein CVT48_01195 [Thermoplasmata archaeon HGW-Thermoplasmata-1]|nr:MAG: hypothetical protein CVT48_01195 [Thermoplasmata archaeon HGW-Thermoplasmata-1]
MLTGKKLSGNTEAITAYHCREENYYFKQGRDMVDEVADKGIIARSDQPLSYVLVRGQLCERLGFKDGQQISEIDFENLLAGRSRAGEKVSRVHKCHGIDLTFSPPKTVSIAGLVKKDYGVIEAHRRAVLETMKEIETFAYGRLTSDTKDHTGKMVWVQVEDGFNREKEPHLHTHCILMNLTEVGDKVVALDGREIMKRDFYKFFDALYKRRLEKELKEYLHYDLTYTKGGEWRLNKISRECEDAFSKRHQQIVEAKEKGMRDMDAWRKTRKDKDNKSDVEDVRAGWQQTFNKLNTKTEEVNKREGEAYRKEWSEKAAYNLEAGQEREGFRSKANDKKKWQLALRRATQNEATASAMAVMTEYLYEKMREGDCAGSTLKSVEAELDKQVEQGNIIEVAGRHTSWEFVRAEREYIETASETTSLYFAEAGKAVAGWNDKSRKKLSPTQSAAAEAILSSREQVVVVQGDAGSGKTTALKAVADAYKSQGVPVIGVAMQGVAAQNLEKEAGVRSYTLKTFFSPQKAKSAMPRVILFDEASMLDSRNAAKLFKLAKNNRDKLVLVGDRNQLESIAAGRVFERLVEIKERKGELVALNENFRQQDPDLRKAVDLARKGKMRDSLEVLERAEVGKHGEKSCDIIEIENKFVKGENVATERREAVAAQYDDKTLVICSTQGARDELNRLIRDKTKLDGGSKKEVEYTLARANADGIDEERKLKLSVGDKITFTKNEYSDYDVRNGERATVVKTGGVLNHHTLTVETEDKRKLEIDTRKYKHIDYGYALTTYKAQGQTFNKVVVEADTSSGPALNDMRNQYVNITRARDSVKIYTDDKETLKDMAGMLEHKRDTLDKIDITLEAAMKQEKKLAERILADTYGIERTPDDEKLVPKELREERATGKEYLPPAAGRARTLER